MQESHVDISSKDIRCLQKRTYRARHVACRQSHSRELLLARLSEPVNGHRQGRIRLAIKDNTALGIGIVPHIAQRDRERNGQKEDAPAVLGIQVLNPVLCKSFDGLLLWAGAQELDNTNIVRIIFVAHSIRLRRHGTSSRITIPS